MRRKYLRRIWNLHHALFQPDAPQIMMLHMTNSHVCKWLLMKRDGKLMVLFCTWNEHPNKVTAQLDRETLHVDVSQVVDARTGENVTAVNGDSFTFEMDGYGVRILRVE